MLTKSCENLYLKNCSGLRAQLNENCCFVFTKVIQYFLVFDVHQSHKGNAGATSTERTSSYKDGCGNDKKG